MTTSTDSLRTGWLSAADCSLDDFMAIVGQQTHLSDYPYADAVERNVLIYGEQAPRRDRHHLRPARGADRADASADRRPGHRGVQAGLRRPVRGRPRHRGVPRPDRRREGGRRRRGGPLRQARRERPGLGRAGQAGRQPTPGSSPSTTPTTSSRWSARRGSVRTTRSPHRSTWSTPVVRRRPRTATTTSASWTPWQPPASRRRCTGSRPR